MRSFLLCLIWKALRKNKLWRRLSGFFPDFHSYTLANKKRVFSFFSRITYICTWVLRVFPPDNGQGLEKIKSREDLSRVRIWCQPFASLAYTFLQFCLISVAQPLHNWEETAFAVHWCSAVQNWSNTLRHDISSCQTILLGANPDKLRLESLSSWEVL